ncbi:MAG TPA: MFS transporter [Thermoleophilaceae bacterium]|jgi:EmrB/QacA subfamily drug resistance transporter
MQGGEPEGVNVEGRWRAFAAVAPAIFISILDLFIVNVAFPDISRDFSDATLSSLSWVLNAYTIVFAALLVPLGKLGDVVGRKKVFQIGLVVFVAGSGLCAAAPGHESLIAARVLQGVGAAAITPNSLGLVLPMFPAGQRAAAIGAWAALGGVGAAMGPPLGGLLTELSWRWIFVVNIPIGLVTVLVVQRRLQELRDPRALLPDAVGSVLAVATVGLLVLGLVKGHDWSWDERSLGCFAAAVVIGALFVLRSLRHRAPVIELDLFRSPAFSLANAAQLLFYAGFGAFLLGGVLFLTEVWGYSVLRAGFGFAPGAVMATIFAGIASRLAERVGPATLGAPGGLMFAVGTGLWTGLGPEHEYVTHYLIPMLIGGAGVGLILPAFTAAAVLAVPEERLATGIAGLATSRQVGAAVGVAAFVALFGTPGPTGILEAFDRSWIYMSLCSTAAGLILLGLGLFTRRREPAAPVEAPPQAGLEPAI